ncbi:MAG: acyl-[ACP]--phospholipid O-acyltransferase [Acidobacteriota bacterium]
MSTSSPIASETPTQAVRLSSTRFLAYLGTAFLGAFNDNAYKAVLIALSLRMFTSEAEQTRAANLVSLLLPIPFLLFSPLAGWLADRFPKHRVILVSKLPEAVSMSLATIGLVRQDLPFLLGVLFLMATQSAFYGPAKFGLLPEACFPGDLTRANGLVSGFSNLGILLGMVFGMGLQAQFGDRPLIVGCCLIGVAFLGIAAAAHVPAGRPGRVGTPVSWNPLTSFVRDLLSIRPFKLLRHGVLGVAYFSFVGATFLIVLPVYGTHSLGLSATGAQGLLAIIAITVALGSFIAGQLSTGRVEIGLAPLGAIGMALSTIDLAFFAPGWTMSLGDTTLPWRALLDVTVLGVSSGLFVVPLTALVQQRAPSGEKGRIVAFSNLSSFLGVVLASFFVWLLNDKAGLDSLGVLGVLAGIMVVGTAVTLWLAPQFLVRSLLFIVGRSLYRLRVEGREKLPSGGGLIVCNHVSYADWLFLGMASDRMVRFLIYRPFYEAWPLHWFLKLMRAIPVSSTDKPDQLEASLEQARDEIRRGHLVCIFAEGGISRTGQLLRFRRGFEKIMKGLDAPVIPACITGAWGSIFSFERGKVFFKWPRQVRYPVTVLFGEPHPSNVNASTIRTVVHELEADGWILEQQDHESLPESFVQTAKKYWSRHFVADSTGADLTFGRAFIGALGVNEVLFRQSRRADEPRVGIWLPPGVGATLANLAVLMDGRVPVNLNYTASTEALTHAVRSAGLKRVITAHRFVEKVGVELPSELEPVFLEDVRPQVRKVRAVTLALLARFLPQSLALALTVRGRTRDPNATATILFSSGSTGVPKGVVLSHGNVRSNIDAMEQIYALEPDDQVLGVLPFFHAFGFTVNFGLPCVVGLSSVHHSNPLDARTVGKLAEKHRPTLLIATPTFLSAYTRRVKAEAFSSLRLVIVGAEKLTDSVREAFHERFDREPLEGYGATECSPVVAVNVPDFDGQTGHRRGTIGRPLPGTCVKVVDPDSREPLPTNREGLLLIKGPNVMQGYLDDPERTAEVLQDGWYATGDIAKVDRDGFIKITDRLSRFAKVGGEMVPLSRVEEAVMEAAGRPEPEEGSGPALCATSVPDAKRGERVVVLYLDGMLEPVEVVEKLADSGLPNLWQPGKRDFMVVDAIPLLGTGKLDLRGVRELAREVVGGGS